MRKFFRAVLVGSAVCLSFAATAHVVRAAAPEPSHADAKGEPEEPHEKGVPLDFKGDLALWSGITFVIFVMLLGRYAWGPLIAALNKREAHIRDDIAAAEAARIKAEQMLAEHAKTLAKVQDEVRAPACRRPPRCRTRQAGNRQRSAERGGKRQAASATRDWTGAGCGAQGSVRRHGFRSCACDRARLGSERDRCRSGPAD